MARSYNGTSDRIVYPAIAAADDLSAFTALAIIKISANVTNEQLLLTKGSETTGDYPLSMYNTDASNQNRLTCYVRGTTQDAYVVSANNTVPLNTWTVAISTWDGGALPKLYSCALGGVLGGELTYALTQNLGGVHASNSSEVIRLGTRSNLNNFFSHIMSETALWNRVLSARELAALGRGFCPLCMPRGLVFYADGDGRATDEINRAPGQGQVGTLTGTSFADHPPIFVPRHGGGARKRPATSTTPARSEALSLGLVEGTPRFGVRIIGVTESLRTGTTDPMTWSHAAGTDAPHAVAVGILHGTSATDHVVSVSYGSLALTRQQRNTDTSTELGAVEWWTACNGDGVSIPTGTQTVSVDLSTATTDDILGVSVTLKGDYPLHVIGRGGISENTTNPTVTIAKNGREALCLAGLYSGLTDLTVLTAGAGEAFITSSDLSGLFTGVFLASLKSDSTDSAISVTAAVDDAAYSVIAIGQTPAPIDSPAIGLTESSTVVVKPMTIDTIGSGLSEVAQMALALTTSDQLPVHTSGILPSYEGIVATRCAVCEEINSTNRQAMSRTGHFARTAISSLKLAFANWYSPVDVWAETGSGSTATITASIEYPAGNFTQVLFSGSASGSIPNLTTLISDAVSVSIPNGEKFWVRSYWVSTTGVLCNPQDISGSGTIGDGFEMGVSGITDKTMSGTVSAADNAYPPVAILGQTTQPSVIIVGDSISWGEQDLTGDESGNFGIVARGVGPKYGFINMAQRGERADHFVASHTLRVALFPYASHLICQYGFNDIFVALQSSATVLANQATVRGYMTALGGGRRAYQTTITPKSTSTDNWATTGNQTTSAQNGTRVTVNASIRALPDYLEVTDVIESARDSGIWKATGSAFGYTPDGYHPSVFSYVTVRDSGAAIPPNDEKATVSTSEAGTTVATADAPKLGLSESSTTFVLPTSIESLAIGLIESSSIRKSETTLDAMTAGMIDSSVVLVADLRLEQLANGLVEAASMAVAFASTDALTSGLTDASTLLNHSLQIEALPTGLLESSTVSPVSTSTSDTLPIGLTESAVILKFDVRLDALAIGIIETSAASITEIVTLSAIDACSVAISELSQINLTLLLSESLSIGLSESAVLSSIRANAAELLAASMIEASRIDSVLANAQENSAASLTEQSAIVVRISTTDTLASGVQESSAMAVSIVGNEVLPAGLAEAVLTAVAFSVQEALPCTLNETLNAVRVVLNGYDDLPIIVVEAAAIAEPGELVDLAASEVLAVSLIEQAAISIVATSPTILVATVEYLGPSRTAILATGSHDIEWRSRHDVDPLAQGDSL